MADEKRKMNDWPTRAETRVMQLLQRAPDGLYAMQIVRTSDGTVTQGGVYVLLMRLENKGFVKAHRPRTQGTHPGLPRPIYRLTATGTRVVGAADELGLRIGR